MVARSSEPLALAGSLQRPLRWLTALSTIPFAITVAVLGLVAAQSGAQRAPPLLLLVLIPAVVLAAQFVLLRRFRRIGVSVEAGELVVNTGLGTRRIALARLRKHGVDVVNLDRRSELKPWLRTMGTGVPGLAAGWFRLRNGQRAVCLLLERERVSYLRSDEDNLSLLLSLENPQALRALLAR